MDKKTLDKCIKLGYIISKMAEIKKKRRKNLTKDDTHYVDNKAFLEAMKVWKEECKEANKKNKGIPPVSNYIAVCFIKIANRLSF